MLTPAEVIDRYEAKRAKVMEVADEVGGVRTARQCAGGDAATCARPGRDALAAAPESLAASVRSGEPDAPITVALAINRALHDILDRYPEAMIFGEDVARKGGVYGVTRGLLAKTSSARVFDTLLDEQSILGLALGAGVSGLLPIPEIQYLAYFHNAADQIRGEGATLQFFSNRQYRNPMVVRVAGYGYQKGFGGHFHNDNSIAAMRDIPGRGHRLARAPRRRRRDVAHLRRRGEDGGRGVHLPRADRAVPHPRPARRRRRAAGSRPIRARVCPSVGPEPTARERI